MLLFSARLVPETSLTLAQMFLHKGGLLWPMISVVTHSHSPPSSRSSHYFFLIPWLSLLKHCIMYVLITAFIAYLHPTCRVS